MRLTVLFLIGCAGGAPAPRTAAPSPAAPAEPAASPAAPTATPAVAAAPAAPAAQGAPAPLVVDEAAVAACRQQLDAYNADAAAQARPAPLLALGRCFADANALGYAIALWNRAEQMFPREAGRDAALAIAQAYERAAVEKPALLARAAETHERFAKKYARPDEAIAHMEAALCMRVQLGDRANASADAAWLGTVTRAPRDPQQFCAGR